MSALAPTPRDRLLDAEGRPYFLWDVDMSIEVFRDLLATGSDEERAYLAAKVMRQAKPDDVFAFLTVDEIAELWPRIRPRLGDTLPFWGWLLAGWEVALGE